MPHETVVKLDTLPETRYSLHQKVWKLMESSRDKKRDFIYAVDLDHGELYVRTETPREQLGPWRSIPPLVEDGMYTAIGTLAIDATRTRVRGQEAFGWSHPLVIDRRVRLMFERFFKLHSLSVSLGRAEPFGKAGRADIFFNPVRVRAEVTVIDAARSNAVLTNGIGRARAFGFGVLHFLPIS